jgi:biopolymer transport protein ExbD
MRLPLTDNESEGPNLTPVIDVVFLLLIFFLVATRFDRQERELDVLPPEVGHAQPLTSGQGLIINISEGGHYTVVQNEYTEAQLAALIDGHGANNPHQPVLIRGDGRSPLRYTARVVSLCKKAQVDCRLAAIEEP